MLELTGKYHNLSERMDKPVLFQRGIEFLSGLMFSFHRATLSLCFFGLLSLAVPQKAVAIDPVTVVVNLTPPFSPFLHEYASFPGNKMQIMLIVNDSRITDLPVRLEMIVENINAGTIMQTHRYATLPVIYLNGFTTEIIQGEDLSRYFFAANNQFQGFTQSQYVQSGRIPDGFYRIGFRVVHYNRTDVIISNTAYTMPGWFLLNDPPQLNSPVNRVV